VDIGKSNIETLLDLDERPVTWEPINKSTGNPFMARDGKTPCTLTTVGADSKRVRASVERATDRMLNARRKKMTPADLHQNRISTAAAAVVQWTGWDDNGVEAECSTKNVEALLALPDVLRQVEEKVNEHADFFVTPSWI
jgi:hypothetical protein